MQHVLIRQVILSRGLIRDVDVTFSAAGGTAATVDLRSEVLIFAIAIGFHMQFLALSSAGYPFLAVKIVSSVQISPVKAHQKAFRTS